MDKIRNADEDQRKTLRESLFPLQSTTKDYAKTQREENRSRNIQKREKLWSKLIYLRNSRFHEVREGFPQIMSRFLKELFKPTTDDEKLLFIRNI